MFQPKDKTLNMNEPPAVDLKNTTIINYKMLLSLSQEICLKLRFLSRTLCSLSVDKIEGIKGNSIEEKFFIYKEQSVSKNSMILYLPRYILPGNGSVLWKSIFDVFATNT